MDVEDNSKILKLISEDNTEHSINFELFSKYSLFIKDNILEHNDIEPLKCALNGTQIEQVLQFIKDREKNYVYKPIPKPIPSGNISLYLQDIDYQFISSFKSETDLYLLLKSAQYFRVEILTELIYAYVAASFIDKTNSEMREKYGIQEPLNEAMEKNLREMYAEFLVGTPFEE